MRNKLIVLLFVILSTSFVMIAAGCNDNQPTKAQNQNKMASEKSSGSIKTGNTEKEQKAGFDWKVLLTKAEASAIIGEAVAPAEYKDTKNPLGQKIIFWSAANEMKLSYVQLSLITTDGMKQQLRDAGSSAKTQFDSEKEVLGNVENMSGIGDEAYWDGDTPLISGLHVLKGDYYFTVMVNAVDKNSQLELEKAQAMKVLERLP